MPDFETLRKSIGKERSNGRYRNESDHLIQLREVVKVYESAANRFVALKGINLTIDAGEFVAVIGKSGSGKSTLLNMLTGIDRPTSGEVIVKGTAIHKLNEGKMAVWRGRAMGIVFQFFQLLPTLTVIENIMLPMDFCRMYSPRVRRQRAMQLLEQMELADQAYKLPSALSGGQQQRVAIARAMANDPPIIVADEPTGNLDSQTAEAVFRLFEKLVDQGKTILMVTHDQDLARQISRTIYLSDGRVVGDKKFASDTRSAGSEPGAAPAGLTPVGSQPPYGEGDWEGSAPLSDSAALQLRVVKILQDRPNAVKLLQKEFMRASQSREMTDALYRIVLSEIRQAAGLAEQAGRAAEARALWKILIDATEPWAKRDANRRMEETGSDHSF